MEHHYTQEQVAAGIIVPVRVDTSENKSDLLTKALGPQVFPGIAQSLVGLIAPSTTQRVLMLRVVAGDEDRENAPPPRIRSRRASHVMAFSTLTLSRRKVFRPPQAFSVT